MKPMHARLGTLFAVICALTLTWQEPAGAEVWRHRDAHRDVARVVLPSTSPAPQRKQGDITQIVAKHDAYVVRIKLRMRTLPTDFLVDIPVKVPGRAFRVTLTDDPSRPPLTLNDKRLDPEPCGDPNFTYSVKPHAFIVTVPRTCLGVPSRVRVGASVAVPDHDGNLLSFFEDDSLRRGLDPQHLARAGPWLDPT